MPSSTSFASSLRRAKARLSEMATQEVSVVDAAANLRRFLITKRDNTVADARKQALKLPTEAKQGIMDGLAQALDKLTALATMVGEAEADDSAAVPADLGLALKQVAELVGGLGSQYAPAGDAAASPPPDAAATPPHGVEMRLRAATDTAAKALPAPLREGDSMKQLLRDGDTLKPKMASVSVAFKALGDELGHYEKAGRKISRERYTKLSELHGALGKLLNELAYDEATEASEKTNKRLDELVDLAKANKQQLDAQAAEIQKLRQPAEQRSREPVPPPAKKGGWPRDLSAPDED